MSCSTGGMSCNSSFPHTEANVLGPDKTPEKILILLKDRPEISIAEIAAHLGKSDSAIVRAIRKLKSQERLRRIGADKGGHWEVNDL